MKFVGYQKNKNKNKKSWFQEKKNIYIYNRGKFYAKKEKKRRKVNSMIFFFNFPKIETIYFLGNNQ